MKGGYVTNKEASHYLAKVQEMIKNGMKIGETKEETQRYFDAFGAGIFALRYAEKGVRKEPILRGDKDYPYCPSCNHRISNTQPKHCPHCGQKLNWEDMFK